jgi:hypothetical protein
MKDFPILKYFFNVQIELLHHAAPRFFLRTRLALRETVARVFFVRLFWVPFRLASRAAIKSTTAVGSFGAVSSSSTPFSFALISF